MLRIFIFHPMLRILIVHPMLRIFIVHPMLRIFIVHPMLRIFIVHPMLRILIVHPMLRILIFHPMLRIFIVHPMLRIFIVHPMLRIFIRCFGSSFLNPQILHGRFQIIFIGRCTDDTGIHQVFHIFLHQVLFDPDDFFFPIQYGFINKQDILGFDQRV